MSIISNLSFTTEKIENELSVHTKFILPKKMEHFNHFKHLACVFRMCRSILLSGLEAPLDKLHQANFE